MVRENARSILLKSDIFLALSLAASGYNVRKQLRPDEEVKSKTQVWWETLKKIDAMGLLLIGGVFATLLIPFTIYTEADNGFKNRALLTSFRVFFSPLRSLHHCHVRRRRCSHDCDRSVGMESHSTPDYAASCSQPLAYLLGGHRLLLLPLGIPFGHVL